VDFVWWRGADVVAIEVKHGREYRPKYLHGLEAFRGAGKPRRYLVYLGAQELKVEGTTVLPIEKFLRRLHAGEIVG
jgi:hypothetical protein